MNTIEILVSLKDEINNEIIKYTDGTVVLHTRNDIGIIREIDGVLKKVFYYEKQLGCIKNNVLYCLKDRKEKNIKLNAWGFNLYFLKKSKFEEIMLAITDDDGEEMYNIPKNKILEMGEVVNLKNPNMVSTFDTQVFIADDEIAQYIIK